MSGRKPQIRTSLGKLRDSYPSLFVGTDEQWGTRVDAYWGRLRKFDQTVVDEACDRAIDKYPDKMPTVGQLVYLCREILEREKTAAREQGRLDDQARGDRETREAVEYLRSEEIPDDPAQQRVWVAESTDPLERLAREYEADSKRRALDPNKPCSPAVAKERMRRFWVTWNSTPARVGSPGKEEPGL